MHTEPLTDYLRLREQLDQQILRLEERHRDLLACGPGCSSCCTLESVLPVEWMILSAALGRVAGDVLERLRDQADRIGSEAESCPLLLGGLCSVYLDRPFICRTHGLAIAYLDLDRECYEVSACPKNFSLDHDFAAENLLLMDDFNSRMQQINITLPADQLQSPARITIKTLLANPA